MGYKIQYSMKTINETCNHIGAKRLAENLNKKIGIFMSYNQAKTIYNEYIETLKWTWKEENSSLSFEEWCNFHSNK